MYYITSSFDCLGFAYRQPQTAGEVLNCDLTDKVNHPSNDGDYDKENHVEESCNDDKITPGHADP